MLRRKTKTTYNLERKKGVFEQVERLMADHMRYMLMEMHAYISSTGYCHCHASIKVYACRELLARLVLTTPARQQYMYALA
jgi:hypothetical protein